MAPSAVPIAGYLPSPACVRAILMRLTPLTRPFCRAVAQNLFHETSPFSAFSRQASICRRRRSRSPLLLQMPIVASAR